MAQEIRTIGKDPGLRFEMQLDSPSKGGASLAWGNLCLYFDEEIIWESESPTSSNKPKPVHWSWIELLEFLGKWWPWLTMEEGYPIPSINPLYPCHLQNEAERRWDDLSEETVEIEEMEVFRYHARHDLAMALNGCYLPSLLVKRQGAQFIFSSASLRESLFRPADEVIATLIELGEYLADSIKGSTTERAQLALSQWNSRADLLPIETVHIRTGLDTSEIVALTADEDPQNFWEWDATAPFDDTEILAAARMSRGILPSSVQRSLLKRIKEIPKAATPKLDKLSASIDLLFSEIGKPHKQGYWLAEYLRRHLKKSIDDVISPEALLQQWNISITEEALESSLIDAISVWGRCHGPAIILNTTYPAKPSHLHGKYSTLAHEICHLLVDRKRALPVGEVLGGNVAEYAEKRARAFAAELLLSREHAARTYFKSDSLETAIEALSNDHEVSEQLVGWQLQNAPGVILSPDETAVLNGITGDYLSWIAET